MIRPAYWCDQCGDEIAARDVRADNDRHWIRYPKSDIRKHGMNGGPRLCGPIRRILPEHVASARATFLQRLAAQKAADDAAQAEERKALP